MRIHRLHTCPGQDPLKVVKYRLLADECQVDYTAPQSWSRAAGRVLAEKIFYKEALPALVKRIPEEGVPAWLWRSEPDDAGLDGISAEWRYRYERDIKDVLTRVAGGITYRNYKAGLFDTEEDARAFHDELQHMILHQMATPEILLMAGIGLNWAYGVQERRFTPRQQISSYGKGTGGSIAFSLHDMPLNILRRIGLLAQTSALDENAPKTAVMLPVESGESSSFIGIKRQHDIDAASKALGKKMLQQAVRHVMDATERSSLHGFDAAFNPALARAMAEAKAAGVSENFIHLALDYARQGFEDVVLDAESSDDEEDEKAGGIETILSLPDTFVESAMTCHGFMLYEGERPLRHESASKLFEKIAENLWQTGYPRIFFRDSSLKSLPFIAGSETVGQSVSGGYVFAADTAAPAAILNLMAFDDPERIVKTEELSHAVRLLVLALEGAATDTKYRPLCLGVTNISALLMRHALPYDSDEGRTVAALAVAIVSGAAHLASAEIARNVGSFSRYSCAEKSFLQAIRDKVAVLSGVSWVQGGMAKQQAHLKISACPSLAETSKKLWEEAWSLGREAGFRHAHLCAVDTEMDAQILLAAQTHDIDPEKTLTRFEGYFASAQEGSEIYGKKLNPLVPAALAKLGYSAADIDDIHFYAVGHATLLNAPHINHVSLKRKGFPQAALDALEAALRTAQHIRYIFNKWTLGEDFCRHMLGFSREDLEDGSFDMLTALGFDENEIEEANLYCCGAMTLEGAPHLESDHLGIFDCAAPLTPFSARGVTPEARIRMQAAVELFLSGAAAHRLELERNISIEAVQKLILLGWQLGVKHLSLYRQGSSLLHPLVQQEKGISLAAETESASPAKALAKTAS